MSFMRWFTIFKRKTKPRSAGLILSKSALEVIPFPMADHGAERRGKGTSHPQTPAHSASSYWPHHSNTTASHVHHLSSHWIQAGSKQHWEPKVSLWASCSLLLQKISAAFSSLLSQQGQFEVTQHLHSERKKTSFCHQKAVDGFPASYLQAHAHWTLIGPHLLCGSSNASPARHWPATESCFLETPFCEDGRGLCCSPLCVHYSWCHISEVTQNGKQLGWEQPKAVLWHSLKKRMKVALKDPTIKPQYIQTTYRGRVLWFDRK